MLRHLSSIIQKQGILAKVKSKIPDFERGSVNIVTLQIFIGTGIYTLKYFEDYNSKRDAACPAIALSPSKGRRRKIGQNGRL